MINFINVRSCKPKESHGQCKIGCKMCRLHSTHLGCLWWTDFVSIWLNLFPQIVTIVLQQFILCVYCYTNFPLLSLGSYYLDLRTRVVVFSITQPLWRLISPLIWRFFFLHVNTWCVRTSHPFFTWFWTQSKGAVYTQVQTFTGH